MTFEKFLVLITLLFAYSLPLWLGLIAVWIYRKVTSRDNYSRDFISGLIFLVAVREFLKNFRFKKY